MPLWRVQHRPQQHQSHGQVSQMKPCLENSNKRGPLSTPLAPSPALRGLTVAMIPTPLSQQTGHSPARGTVAIQALFLPDRWAKARQPSQGDAALLGLGNRQQQADRTGGHRQGLQCTGAACLCRTAAFEGLTAFYPAVEASTPCISAGYGGRHGTEASLLTLTPPLRCAFVPSSLGLVGKHLLRLAPGFRQQQVSSSGRRACSSGSSTGAAVG